MPRANKIMVLGLQVCVLLLIIFCPNASTNPNAHPKLGALSQDLQNLEIFLRTVGSVGYAVGHMHTLADVHILAHITFFGSGFWIGIPANYADGYTRIKSICQTMANHESIKEYYDKKAVKSRFDQIYIAQREFK